MALHIDIGKCVDALDQAERRLCEAVEAAYPEGSRVRFRKFTYYGVQDLPVLTGKVLWTSVKVGQPLHINMRIQLDDEHIPCDWQHASGDKTLVLINILEKEYDLKALD